MPTLSSALVVADTHLNAKPRDAYRWRVWDAISETAEERACENIFILGDLTHDKDFHSAHVVNGITDQIADLARLYTVHILRGNHDGIDPDEPYWRFLDHIQNVHYYKEPAKVSITCDQQVVDVLMLPHVANAAEAAAQWERFSGKSNWDCAMTHITVEGAHPDIGDRPMPGIPASQIQKLLGEHKRPIYSGDVHTRQTVAGVQYVGAPYHINFGDEYQGGCLVLMGDGKGKGEYIDFDDFPRRRKFVVRGVDDIKQMDLYNADQAKVVVELTAATMHEWQALREQVETEVHQMHAELVSIDFNVSIVNANGQAKPAPGGAEAVPYRAREAFEKYCKKRELSPELVKAGFACFERAEK